MRRGGRAATAVQERPAAPPKKAGKNPFGWLGIQEETVYADE